MADLNNLLDEISDEEAIVHDTITSTVLNDSNREEVVLNNYSAVNDAIFNIQNDAGTEGPRDEDEDADGGNEDPEYTQLKNSWIQELCCPEILPYDSETMALHTELIHGQEELVEKLISSDSCNTNAVLGGERASSIDPMLTSFAATIYRMDMNRVRFIMEDLARIRLRKIETHPLYMRDMVERMSEEEASFLKSYGELIEKHFRRAVLDQLPKAAYQKLDDPDMIDTPDLDEYVFCHVLENIIIDPTDGKGGIDDDDDEGPQDYEAGSSLIAKYRLVRNLVLEGKVSLML